MYSNISIKYTLCVRQHLHNKTSKNFYYCAIYILHCYMLIVLLEC